jgi:putative transposase
VQMSKKGYSYRQIQDVLQMSLGFISASNQRYAAEGVTGLSVKYWGTQGYLSPEDKAQVLSWLAQKEIWFIEEVMEHLEVEYGVVYRSRQSYYSLMAQAGLSWKKAQPVNPLKDETQVAQKNRKSSTYWGFIKPISPVDG